MLAPLVAVALAAGPDPQTAAALTAAVNAYQATLDAFPVLTVEHTVRLRTAPTLAEAVAAAPPTPDSTGRVRVVRRDGVTRVTVVEDPDSGRARSGGPVGPAGPDGKRYGAPYTLTDGDSLAAGGRLLNFDRRDRRANLGAGGPNSRRFVLYELASTEWTFPRLAGEALAGRLDAKCKTEGDRLTATFSRADGFAATAVLDTARGHLPLSVAVDQPATENGKWPRSTFLHLVTPEACSGGRWFPGRFAWALFQEGKPLAMGFEYQVTALDADSAPTDDQLAVPLPAGTVVWPDTQVVGQPIKYLKLPDDRTVRPDDLGSLLTEADRLPSKDRRVVGGTEPTPREAAARRQWWRLGGGAAAVLALVVGLALRRRRGA